MSNQIDNQRLQTYYKQIKKALPMYSKSERTFIEKFQKSVESFVAEFPDASFTNLLDHFGTPDQVSQHYLSSLEPDDLYKRIVYRRRIKRIMTFIAVFAIIAFCCYAEYLYDEYSQLRGGYSILETIIYE